MSVGVVGFFLVLLISSGCWLLKRKRGRGRGREREIVKKEYLNKVAKTKKVWNIGCVVKWYSIIDKTNF